MSLEAWRAVDDYLDSRLIPHDPILEATLTANREAGLAEIDVAQNQGKLLALMIKMSGASKILELGTLGAYSTIWMARAIKEAGQVITLEVDEKHAAIARSNLQRARVADKVQLLLGPAAESLSKLHAEGAGPFDFIFIDADKPNNPVYLDWALRLSRVGTIIVVDNVIRRGHIVDAESQDPKVQGTRSMFDMMSKSGEYLEATAVQTVGSKGWDGLAVARVLKPKTG